MENEFKTYVLYCTKVKARRSLGGLFYEIVLPNGEKFKVLRRAFEAVAKETPDGNSTE